MALETLAAQIKDLRDTASKIQAHFSKQLEEIEQDTALSAEGKRQAREAKQEQVKQSLVELRTKENNLLDEKILDLERRLDGFIGYSTSDIIAFRDAQDRAENLTEPDTAAAMIARAMRNGDRTLAQAVYRHALEKGWSSVAKIFETENPELAEAARELVAIRTNRTEGSIQRALAYSSRI